MIDIKEHVSNAFSIHHYVPSCDATKWCFLKQNASQVSSHQVKRPNLGCHDIFAQRGNPPWYHCISINFTHRLFILQWHLPNPSKSLIERVLCRHSSRVLRVLPASPTSSRDSERLPTCFPNRPVTWKWQNQLPKASQDSTAQWVHQSKWNPSRESLGTRICDSSAMLRFKCRRMLSLSS